MVGVTGGTNMLPGPLKQLPLLSQSRWMKLMPRIHLPELLRLNGPEKENMQTNTQREQDLLERIRVSNVKNIELIDRKCAKYA